jgi:futalosine hydrolase
MSAARTADPAGVALPDRPDLLVCAATAVELEAFGPSGERARGAAHPRGIAFLVTGVGIAPTFSRLLPLVLDPRRRPRRLLNIGIAGAYPGRGLGIGDLVMGASEVFGDVGFELPDPPGFRAIGDSPFAAGFYDAPIPLAPDPAFRDPAPALTARVGNGCTVNACAGTDATGALRARLFDAHFESMEGAAVARIGHDAGVPVCELRAVSNIAGRRDMRPENVRFALERLRRYLDACRERAAAASPTGEIS